MIKLITNIFTVVILIALFFGVTPIAYASMPSAATSAVTNITQTSVTLNGQINPNGAATNVWFEYGTSDFNILSTSVPIGSGTTFSNVSRAISFLQPNTTYIARIVAQNAHGIRYGNTITFRTSAAVSEQPVQPVGSAPSVTTFSAGNISQTSVALNGQVNPNGAATTFWFEYGIDNFNISSPVASMGSGSTVASVNIMISNLLPNTTYMVRAVAQNAHGIRYGNTITFRTSAAVSEQPVQPVGSAPSAATSAVTNITQTSVTLNGQVNPNGAATNAWFEYGTSDFNLFSASASVGSGSALTSFSRVITGLQPNTTYIVRIAAQNAHGIRYGNTITFRTSGGAVIPPAQPDPTRRVGAPEVFISPASRITSNSAMLQGNIEPNGDLTEYWFEFGINRWNLSRRTAIESVNASAINASVSMRIDNLALDTVYHYRLVARNSFGTARSHIREFITSNVLDNFNENDIEALRVRTNRATNITTTSATLNAEVTNEHVEATVWFEYGYTGRALNYRSPSVVVSNRVFSQNVAINIIGLSPDNRYDFRVVARNKFGTVRGGIMSFGATRTGIDARAAHVNTEQALNITNNSATLQALVDPRSDNTSLWFEYGTSAFDLRHRSSIVNIAANTGSRRYQSIISGLEPNTIYFYRAVAQNAHAANRGEVRFFRTSGGFITGGLPAPRIIERKVIVEPQVVKEPKELNVFLDLSLNNLEVRAGDYLDYTLTYRNASGGKITDAVIKTNLPFDVEYVDASVKPTSIVGNNLVFNIGEIANGSQGVIVIRTKVKENVRSGSTIEFNALLEYIDEDKELQTIFSSVDAETKIANNRFLASLSMLIFGYIAGWLPWILLLILLFVIIYLIASRKREREAAAVAIANASAGYHQQ